MPWQARIQTMLGKRFWIGLLLCMSYLLAFMQRTGPGVVSTTLQHTFHVSGAVLGTMTSVQYLLYMILQIPVGLSGDKLGPEKLLAAGVCLDGIGTLCFADSHQFAMLLVGRAVVGLGDALIWVNIVLIIGGYFLPSQFGALLGIVSTAGNVGALLTTIPFAAWTTVAGWREPFALLGILLVITAVFDFAVIRKKRPTLDRVSVLSDQPEQFKIKPVPIRSILSTVIQDRNAWATFFCHFSAVGTYIGFVGLWAVPYFEHTYAVNRSLATTFTLTAFVGALIGGPLAGTLTDRIGSRRGTYIVLQVFICLSWLSVPLFAGQPPVLIAYMLMFVLGLGSGGSLLTFAVIRDQTPAERAGVTSGFANTGGFLSAVLLPVLFGALYDAHLRQGIHTAYAVAFLVPTGFTLLGVIGSLFIRERRQAFQNEVGV
ncbi:MFS transporter [Alicyclobacillus tolerans]|uniref:Nitrate/nitrite transporter NarK n=2 Tax=Alicyclobacillus tolerans TaxID=90970 RepID=A0A1M6KYY0_9BACL|nr:MULTISPECIES: MFS transporter [Alicyclobacillus]MDP9727618.1 nitrate/nitrite transporter NarK [Alicyclobacillus tengchongensis]SHJ64185.1 Nitrate/nitrite transporter NarK [Alicyclobacillus montanus]